MDAWAEDSFGNDSAADWAGQFAESGRGLEAVAETLNVVMQEGPDYSDSDFAVDAIAACEVIARLRGHWGNGRRIPRNSTLGLKATPRPSVDSTFNPVRLYRVLRKVFVSSYALRDDGRGSRCCL